MQTVFRTVWGDVTVEKPVLLKLKWQCTHCNKTLGYVASTFENEYIKCHHCGQEYIVTAEIRLGTPPRR